MPRKRLIQHAGLIKLGQRARDARLDMRWSQKEAGARIGVHKNTISKYERGEVQPGPDVLQNMAREYKVTVAWLWGGEMAEGQGAITSPPESDEDLGPDRTGSSGEGAAGRLPFGIENLSEEQSIRLSQLEHFFRSEGRHLEREDINELMHALQYLSERRRRLNEQGEGDSEEASP